MLFFLGRLGYVLTKLKSNGRWVCDVVFLDSLLEDGESHHCESVGAEEGLKYSELKEELKKEYGIYLPNIDELVLLGKNSGGEVYNAPPNIYWGEDVLNNTFKFLGFYNSRDKLKPLEK